MSSTEGSIAGPEGLKLMAELVMLFKFIVNILVTKAVSSNFVEFLHMDSSQSLAISPRK